MRLKYECYCYVLFPVKVQEYFFCLCCALRLGGSIRQGAVCALFSALSNKQKSEEHFKNNANIKSAQVPPLTDVNKEQGLLCAMAGSRIAPATLTSPTAQVSCRDRRYSFFIWKFSLPISISILFENVRSVNHKKCRQRFYGVQQNLGPQSHAPGTVWRTPVLPGSVLRFQE